MTADCRWLCFDTDLTYEVVLVLTSLHFDDKAGRFVSKQGNLQPGLHSWAKQLSTQLQNGIFSILSDKIPWSIRGRHRTTQALAARLFPDIAADPWFGCIYWRNRKSLWTTCFLLQESNPGGNNTTSLLHAKKIEVKLYKTNTHRYKSPFSCHSTSTIPAFYRALIWVKTLVAEAVHDPTNIKKVYTSLEFVLSFNLSQSHPSLFHFSLLLSFWCFSNFLNCCLLFFRYNSSFFTIQ